MKEFLGLFKSLNEGIYVADMDSYELVYMNDYLKELYKISSEEEYKGKKCYAVLQGRSEPCIFCTNSRLRPGKFYEWSYRNPVLDREAILKDTMFEKEGKRYRLELAFDTSACGKRGMREEGLFAYGDSIINECLRKVISINDPNEAIEYILSYMGEHFLCGRVYIFENEEGGTFSNTYEWCAEGVAPQKEVLQHEPLETIESWYRMFEDDKPVIIENLEDVRRKHPEVYAVLKPQDIDSLVTVPIRSAGEVIGFLGVDNPSVKNPDVIVYFLFVVGHFISTMLERRNLLAHLEYMSYHDQLTGSLNRYAFLKLGDEVPEDAQVGVLYCDISGLKMVNDTLGHSEGDEIIVRWYRIIRKFFREHEVFRTGGDEFVVVSQDISKVDFLSKVESLKEEIALEDNHLSLGSAWASGGGIQPLLMKAEEKMYEDKYDYYNRKGILAERKHQRQRSVIRGYSLPEVRAESSLYQFVSNNFFDLETLFDSITAESAPYYLYFGDVQSNWFYISDNMRDRFGFKSNMVYDLMSNWENRIINREELLLYREDLTNVMEKKQKRHDLRYRVRDKDGNDTWIHCCGQMKWSEDGGTPLFFAGFISYQQRDFIVDPITNFPREHAATIKIAEMRKNGKEVLAIGFTLNNFAEINELRGRNNADLLLLNIAEKLTYYFDERMTFYRLDGLRFMGIVSPVCKDSVPDLIAQLKDIVNMMYRGSNIVVRIPCSVGVFAQEDPKMSPQEIISNIIALISEAKHLSDRDYVVHSARNTRMQKEHARMVMELSENVFNDFEGFRIVVQPIVSTKDKKIVSGEALLRWRFEGKEISPLTFIPILEKNRLILPVGKWVFEQVVRTCKRAISHMSDFRLAFNVSYHQVLDSEFLPFIQKTLKKYLLDGRHLIMELTETHFDESPDKLDRFISNCKELGIEIALDDFGNGYSSLGLLLKYPANVVKLDKSLLNSMTTSEDNIKFISSIVYACHQFGKKVCAEGVETEKEAEIIKGTNCDMMQGYHFYRPLEQRDLYGELVDQANGRKPDGEM